MHPVYSTLCTVRVNIGLPNYMLLSQVRVFLRGFCLQGKSYARIGGTNQVIFSATNQVIFLATNQVTFLATNQIIFLAMPVAQHLTPSVTRSVGVS